MEDQNNKLQKVGGAPGFFKGSFLLLEPFVFTGAEASGGEDGRHELQPGRGGGEVQESEQAEDQTRVHDLRPGG